MTQGVREPTVAGVWYSSDPQQLRSDVDDILTSATVETGSPKVLVVPSGPMEEIGSAAAGAWGLLAAERGKIERVIILGTNQNQEFEGIALPRSVAFRTPLGDVLLDQPALQELMQQPDVQMSDRPHQRATSIEVQLPFLQRMVGRARIVPVIVGAIGASSLSNLLELLWGGPETLVVLSMNLSRGQSEQEIAAVDRDTAQRITALDSSQLTHDQTNATSALKGLLGLARRRGMTTSVLNTTVGSSGDRDGDLVGYGSFGLWESPLFQLAEPDVNHLMALATTSAQATVLGGEVSPGDGNRLPPELTRRRAAFVTAFVDNQVRGSAGSLEAQPTLGGAVAQYAGRAVSDDREGIVRPDELDRLQLGITILGPLERVRPENRQQLVMGLQQGVDGLLARRGKNRATFLPAVWASIPDAGEFVDQLFARAQIGDDVPFGEIVLHRYHGLQLGAS